MILWLRFSIEKDEANFYQDALITGFYIRSKKLNQNICQ